MRASAAVAWKRHRCRRPGRPRAFSCRANTCSLLARACAICRQLHWVIALGFVDSVAWTTEFRSTSPRSGADVANWRDNAGYAVQRRLAMQCAPAMYRPAARPSGGSAGTAVDPRAPCDATVGMRPGNAPRWRTRSLPLTSAQWHLSVYTDRSGVAPTRNQCTG